MTDHKHTCRRCKTRSSVFWYPYAWGVGIDEDGVVKGGQHFEMCDECQRSFIDWMVKGDKS